MQKIVVSFTVVVTMLTAGSCNRRVFEEVKASCDRTIGDEIEVPTDKAADILIVVDNSGSMAEEQDELVDNFLNQDAGACPLQDLKNIPTDFVNPSRDLYTAGGPLANCGFIQLLAAFENDFRVGVITTDVGLCDNRIPSSQGGDEWGFRSQRGCLQPDGAPGTGGLRKVISAADLADDDNGNDDFAQRFRDTLENISVFGSPFERGLDAMSIFLDPNAESRGPGCEGDLELFRRDDAALVVIFLTDEEDCSHGLGDGSFDNELEGEICGEFIDIVQEHNPANCYASVDELPPPSLYVDQLLAADPNAKVAVIAGGLGEPGNVSADGCTVGGDGAPSGDCYESGGLSNFTGENQPCGPGDFEESRGGLPCCLADPGGRYYEFANEVGKKTTDSICNASFRSTMLDIAAFIAAVDFVELPEEPASPNAIVVSLTRAGETEATTIQPLAPGADCATEDGWLIENGTRIVLCGQARPGPGDTIEVLAKGISEETCAAGG
jgi:hypothetical protein